MSRAVEQLGELKHKLHIHREHRECTHVRMHARTHACT